ncbi:molecular chaperone DnaK suppressor DksA [Malaciobacter molluscorum LMG 25693]|uniref:DksA family protein n=1 Tax=Malaciobacter molluscorum LMG 25693 TaxID=870501 RepID=A0A2G1DHU7_9BACT|nr:RNA polymerase-binding protein DksA [Malaciobacter molluscorum]AXX93674.1 DksA family protein [Malaciobacter molluscorum LMG 25693]PHO17916.1 molecular chaperone DnaK suppressor DksA [Malaciobacter molluscorum LMG 25693]RXJ93649.1 molecular chaperone DnaK suppressor DksA [Malaciobacter molluscorum]
MAKALNEKQVEEIKVLLLENKQKIETALRKIDEDHESLSTMDLKDEGDFAAASRDYSNDIHIKKQQKKELELIDHALKKIEKGEYTGLCEMCDSEITIKRLRVKPHARYCIDCRSFIDNEKKER